MLQIFRRASFRLQMQEPTESGDMDEDEDEEDEDDVVWMTDTSEAAMAKRAAEQLSAATSAMVTQVCAAWAGRGCSSGAWCGMGGWGAAIAAIVTQVSDARAGRGCSLWWGCGCGGVGCGSLAVFRDVT